MRKPCRLTTVLLVLFCTLGLILLLSSLVEAPAAAQPSHINSPVTDAQFLPALPLVPETSPGNRWFAAVYQAIAYIAFTLPAVAHLLRCCDANGRVLRKRRYVQSFHPVFKQELACG